MSESSGFDGGNFTDLAFRTPRVPSWVGPELVDKLAREIRSCGMELSSAKDGVSFSVVIPTRSSSPRIDAVRSVLRCRRQDGESIEVICALGDQPSAQRNMALTLAQGPHIGFLDDDCLVSPDWMLRALENLKSTSASVVGGPNLTPHNSSFFSKCVGKVLASRWGTASMRARYSQVGNEIVVAGDEKTQLCNMVFDRKVFESFRFNEDMFPNEENELLSRIADEGHELLYDPKLTVTHPRKTDLTSFARQIFRYGRGRARQTKLQPRTLSPIHVFPSLTLIGTIAFLASLFLGPTFLTSILGPPLLAYVMIVFLSSARIASSLRSFKAFLLSALLYPSLHFSYGAGFLLRLLIPDPKSSSEKREKRAWLLRFAAKPVGH